MPIMRAAWLQLDECCPVTVQQDATSKLLSTTTSRNSEMNQAAIRKGSQAELQQLLNSAGYEMDQFTNLQWNKDLVRFSTSVKRLLALKRQASVKGNDESSPKADE